MFSYTCAFWHEELDYNAMCVEHEDSVIILLNEELDMDPDVRMDLEKVEETASEESRDKMAESNKY